MKVVKILTKELQVKFLVIDNYGDIIIPIAKYLKSKDTLRYSKNTLKRYAFALKSFFEFLDQENLNYLNINIEDMSRFQLWLQAPYDNLNIIPFKEVEQKREPRTINQIISIVLQFYDYLMRNSLYSGKLNSQMKIQISSNRRGYKGFLHHITKDKNISSNYLKMREKKKKLKTLNSNQINILISACKNNRDKFLLYLLWESGIRIGEALSLWLEDFQIDSNKISIKDRGALENNAEIKTIHSEREIDISDNLKNLFINYIVEYHNENISTNHIFIKLAGQNKGEALDYDSVVALFKRLHHKTNIKATAHMFRHTSFTELFRNGMKPEYIKERAGHKDIQTTYQLYIHPSDQDIRKDWEKCKEKMKGIKWES